MKILNWAAWAAAGVAAIIILLGVIAILTTNETFLGFRDTVNFFHAANSLLLMAIFLFIATKKKDS